MAKKPARGGRVTPKGTQPASNGKPTSTAQPAIDHRIVNRFDPASQRGGGAGAPTRGSHHRGNR